MDFDVSKENIQPLKGGRNATQLGVALQAQYSEDYQRQLTQQRQAFENAIRTYQGDDPLDNWYHYISWVEQSYPKNGDHENFVMLEECLAQFENDPRYRNDRRFCKLWIKFFDLQKNTLELYRMIHARGICTGCADLYKAWAYYHEAAGDYKSAKMVLEYGLRVLAQPYEDLVVAKQHTLIAAGEHMISGKDERRLTEKRQALTSLSTYRPGMVGSVRVPSATTGVLPMSTPATLTSNTVVPVFQDNEDHLLGAAAAVPLSILTAVKRQDAPKENVLKPGTWTNMHVKQQVTKHKTPSFTVHIDDEEDVHTTGIKLPPNFFPTNYDDYSNFNTAVYLEEPPNPTHVPMYPKQLVYSEPNKEYSLEELRAARYLRQRSKRRLMVTEVETQQAVQSILGTTEQEVAHQSDLIVLNDERNQNLVQNTSVRQEKAPEVSYCTVQKEEADVASQFSMKKRLQKDFGLDDGCSPADTANNSFAKYWDSLQPDKVNNVFWNPLPPKRPVGDFMIYQDSIVDSQTHQQPKVSAMKTPLKTISTADLAETGSRGGLDIAAAAQPTDDAKRLPIYEDDGSSSPVRNTLDNSLNTQVFNFDLNAMKVSTPFKSTQQVDSAPPPFSGPTKQLFAMEQDSLSTIVEESKSYGSSSSGSGIRKIAGIQPPVMATISEEHNNYLATNLMANAALRSTLLGDLMDCNSHQSIPVAEPSPPAKVQQTYTSPGPVLSQAPDDPFSSSVISMLLDRVGFPGRHAFGFRIIHAPPRLVVRKEVQRIGSEDYLIDKQLGKGRYGTVFKAVDWTGRQVALKYEKPANKWEFYICRELQQRLAQHPMRDRFMDVQIGYFHEQASVLVTDFGPCGSLLDVRNAIKQKTGQNMKQSLCIYFCIEMLNIISALHSAKIIHADIKPDNFLVQLAPDETVKLQLIDFGRAIDMSLFPAGTTFRKSVATENFICCEMQDGRPWSYHTDLFCVAATAHVLLFHSYIELQKRGGSWSIKQRLARYMRLDLWNNFFDCLLNQKAEPSDTTSLRTMLSSGLEDETGFQRDMRLLVNLLKDR